MGRTMGVDEQEPNGQNALNKPHSALIADKKRSLLNFKKKQDRGMGVTGDAMLKVMISPISTTLTSSSGIN
jgi:hypothetical protein